MTVSAQASCFAVSGPLSSKKALKKGGESLNVHSRSRLLCGYARPTSEASPSGQDCKQDRLAADGRSPARCHSLLAHPRRGCSGASPGPRFRSLLARSITVGVCDSRMRSCRGWNAAWHEMPSLCHRTAASAEGAWTAQARLEPELVDGGRSGLDAPDGYPQSLSADCIHGGGRSSWFLDVRHDRMRRSLGSEARQSHESGGLAACAPPASSRSPLFPRGWGTIRMAPAC